LLINSPSDLGTISLLAASNCQKFGSGRLLADLSSKQPLRLYQTCRVGCTLR